MSLSQKEIISLLNEEHKANHTGSRITAEHGRNVLSFVSKIYGQLTSKTVPNVLTQNQNNVLLSAYAYNLMIYRACCADINQNLNLFTNDYLKYTEENNIYTRALNDGNPLVLRRHIIQLFDLIADTNRRKLPPFELHSLHKRIVTLIEGDIPSLNPKIYRTFKAYMFAYAHTLMGLFMAFNLPEDRKNSTQIQNIFTSANKIMLEVKYPEKDNQEDHSLDLYADKNIVPPLPLGSVDETIHTIQSYQSSNFDSINKDITYQSPK